MRTDWYPVHYSVERPPRFTRVQLLIRVIAFCALGVIGLSFGTMFLVAYLALPVFAASRVASQRDREYADRDGPRVVGVLRWVAAITAWAGLVAERLPGRAPEETVRLEIAGRPRPTPGSAMWRIVTGLPSAVVLAVLCWVGMFVWLWAALSVLVTERVGAGAFHYLVGLQRWSLRLLAYQASLVDDYPPFSLSETPSLLPEARVSP
jgi:hypothetical protein